MSWKFELAYLSDITNLCAHACLLSLNSCIRSPSFSYTSMADAHTTSEAWHDGEIHRPRGSGGCGTSCAAAENIYKKRSRGRPKCTLDRGLDTQHAGVGEEADKERREEVVLPSPFIHSSHLNSPLEYQEYRQGSSST